MSGDTPKLHVTRGYQSRRVNAGPQDPYQHAPTESHDTPPNPEPDYLSELAQIPEAVWQMHNELHNLYGLLLAELSPRPFDERATLSNFAATALTINGVAGSWAAAFTQTSQSGVELADMLIGTDTAQTVQLLRVPAAQLDATIPTIILATLRTTANQLTQLLKVPVRLGQGESLCLFSLTSAAAHFDFSCRYRYPRT